MKSRFSQAAMAPQSRGSDGPSIPRNEGRVRGQTHAELVAAFEAESIRALDAGTFDADGAIDAVNHVDAKLLQDLSPMLKARMMGVLSREYHAIIKDPSRKARLEEREFAKRIQDAGQRIAIETTVPFSIVKRFYDLETVFAQEVRAEMEAGKANGATIDLNMKLTPDALMEAAEHFNDLLGRIYGHGFRTQTIVTNDAKSKVMGQAGFDVQARRLVIESNVAGIKKLGDLPQLVGTLAHENVHSVIAGMWNTPGFDPEDYRVSKPDFYMLMRICDRTFYSLDKAIYRKHPEEILAERVGVRIGVCMSRLMGKPRLKEEFAQSAGLYDTPIIARELDFIFRDQDKAMPKSAETEGQTTPGRKGMGVRALLSHLKKHF